MEKKRKQSTAESCGPVKKQQMTEAESLPNQNPNEAEEYEYELVEEEVEVEEEEEDDDDDEEEDDDAGDEEGEEEDGKEPIQKLLEPFSKEQLVALLLEASNRHRDIASSIRKMADEDPAQRKIFVHGLGWDTNTETLINAFRQYGEIEDGKAVCDKMSGKSKGYGFVLFKTRSGAQNALMEPQKKIGNRMTACQLASVGPTTPSQQAAAAPVQQLVSEHTLRKIYVSNVGAELDPKKLADFFAKYGEIEQGPLGLDKVTGKPKGFCLFVYKTTEGAKKALEEPHKNFEGHTLHCQKAIDGPKPGKSQHGQQQQNSHSSRFQRVDNSGYGLGPMVQYGAPPMGIGQGSAAVAPALNPALGQAITALLATQGAGLGIGNLLGTLGTAAAGNPAVPTVGHGLQAAYGSQVNSGVVGAYGTQAAYPTQQQMGQAAPPRGQYSGQYPGTGPYMGH